MGLRNFSILAFLKKNLNFVLGVISEIGLVVAIMAASLLITLVLILIKP